MYIIGKNTLSRSSGLICLLAFALCGYAYADSTTLVGEVIEVAPDYIVMESGEKYSLWKKYQARKSSKQNASRRTRVTTFQRVKDEDYLTEFYDGEHKINFNSVYGVGYITKAKITLRDGHVTKVEILNMEQ